MHGNRTLLRQELEKQRLELERKRDEENAQMRREMAISQQTPSMEVPSNQPNQAANQVTIEVPNNVLEVRTKLAHPTNFHVNEVQKRQVTSYLSSSASAQQSRSAPIQNMRGLIHPGLLGNAAIKKDPLLSGAGSGGSPMKTSSSFNPQMGSPMSNPNMGSPIKPNSFTLQPTMGMFNSQPSGNIPLKTPESPTMMSVDQNTDDIQEQIIEDIMGLEEKFGDTLGLPYLESTLVAPQTLPVSSNLFDTFGGSGTSGGTAGVGTIGTGNPMIVAQMSASCPANVKNERGAMQPADQSMMGVFDHDLKLHEKERQKKNNHNMIERRRRFNINDRIKELGSLLPANEAEARQNKGTILKASVDYIRKLQRDHDRMKLVEAKQKQLENTNRQMRLRIQELELTARAHQIPTPSLTPETVKLAEAAEQALGSVTPRSKSPRSANVTPVNMFGGTDDLSDILRNSPNMDFSKLQIKQERPESLSPCVVDQLSPLQRPPSGGPLSYPQTNQRIGDIFSFNLPPSSGTMMPTLQPPPQSSTVTTDSGIQLFGNT